MTAWTLALLLLASAGAGFIDAIVGGGGLVLIPALMAVATGLPPATVLIIITALTIKLVVETF
ncbi:MAG: hypothetical protein SPI77_02005 [Corynebacterium sp.]|nr:hypothetical protein [Corynebacterium sp.]